MLVNLHSFLFTRQSTLHFLFEDTANQKQVLGIKGYHLPEACFKIMVALFLWCKGTANSHDALQIFIIGMSEKL